MKISDMVNQLLKVLPTQTDAFSEKQSVTLSYSGGLVTATTPLAHNVTTGKKINISGANFPTSISSITRVGDIATATTATDHDLTEGYHPTVNIEGADQTEYNGDKVLLEVKNRRTFTFTVTGSPATPATGALILNEDRLGYNGYHVATVTSPTTLTYPISTAPNGDSSGEIKTGLRISGGVAYDRVLASYTAQGANKAWLFVVPQPSRVSRSTSEKTDAINFISQGSNVHILELESFSLYVFLPSKDIAGEAAYDTIQDLMPKIYASLVGYMPPSLLAQDRYSGVTPTENGFHDYNGAFYIHYIDFQLVRAIGADDVFVDDESVAFRDITMTSLNDFNENLTVAQVDLDKEQLP